MGKKERRKRRKERQRQKARYNAYAHERYIDRLLADEAYKAKQSAYSKKIRELENEKLQRTVFVTNVLDLRDEQNLRRLKQFMLTTFGPVEECVTDTFRGKRKGKRKSPYPPARVRFERRQDAEKLFGGKSVIGASRVLITCPIVGNRGRIFVSPAQRYENMIKESDLKGHLIDFPANGIALGHWCPRDDDSYLTWIETLGSAAAAPPTESEEWIEEVELKSACRVQIDLSRRLVEINFDCRGAVWDIFGRSFRYFVSFRFKELRDYIYVCRERSSPDACSLVLALKYPPMLERAVELPDELQALVDDEFEPARERCVEIPGIDNDFFGRCLGIRIPLENSGLTRLLAHEGFRKLVDFGVLRPGLRSLDLWSLRNSDEITVIHRPVLLNLHMDRSKMEADMANIHEIDEELGFVLRSLVDEGKFSWFHLLRDADEAGSSLLDVLADHACYFGQSKTSVQILSTIGSESGSTKYPCKLFRILMDTEGKSTVAGAPPSYCMRIPRVLLSPCKIRVLSYETEMSNRVLRHFVKFRGFSPHSFLRLQTGDENGRKLYSQSLSESVETRLKDKIINGIKINGRLYKMLAYSSSQLKECSVWLVHLEKGYTVERIRRELGDFSSCPSASKYAARIGQCFSTTIQGFTSGSTSATSVMHSQIDDIPVLQSQTPTERVHSDGTGLISRDSMNMLLRGIPFAPQDPNDASIVQIRFGGVKGTLTAWDFSSIGQHVRFPIPSHVNVFLRPSMIKFRAQYTNVEVCSVGSNIPYYLNRNVILILSVLGVADEIFLQIQARMLNDLDQMLTSNRKAMEVSPRLSGPDSNVRSTIGKMLLAGLSPATEPFLFSLLHAIRSHHLLGLRKKSRIFIDRGAVLMGGIDETGLVPEGCVFVQTMPRGGTAGSRDSQLITGPVMVTKHPVMHLGDVRMLLAVDVPALRGHRNVILFSRHGLRPEPDKMAGSDLDGDEFAVTWDERLFLRGWNCRSEPQNHMGASPALIKSLADANHEPLDFAAEERSSPPIPTDDHEKTKALVQHFVDHAKNDNLGRIAMMWLDHASIKGAACDECFELAKLHSLAVDFPKSGVPVEVPKELTFKRGTPRAHWREYKNAGAFNCSSAVGRLYDQVVNREEDSSLDLIKALAGRHIDRYGQIMTSVRFAKQERLEEVYDAAIPLRLGLDSSLVTSSRFVNIAIENREWFEEDMLRLMNRYKIRSEGELITGCIRKLHKLNKQREYKVAEELRRQVRHVVAEHRTQFFETLKDLHTESLDSGLKQENGEQGHTPEDETSKRIDSEEEDLARLETLVTCSRPFDGILPGEIQARKIAFRLAGAYYHASYCPEVMEYGEQKTVLFGFPWMVCADVIASGLEEATDDSVLTTDQPSAVVVEEQNTRHTGR